MANLRCEIRDLQFDNDKLKIEKQKFVNLAEQGSLTEKKQLVELEDLCEQLLERERVIKELEIERDLMTTEFQEHIRNLQKKPLVSPDIKMEIDEVLETKCTKEIDEVLVTKCTKVDPENCLEAETGSASLIIKEVSISFSFLQIF